MSNQPVDRRTLFRTAGALGVGVVGAGALTGCGSGGGGDNGGGAGGGAAAAPITVPVSSVPVGGGTILSDKLVVVTQPTAGQFKAFSARCTHQGCPVTRVENGKISCPCHDSQFDITTGAPTPESPAKSPLDAKTATVSGDTITVA
jgi:Rieske Fe-S protein